MQVVDSVRDRDACGRVREHVGRITAGQLVTREQRTGAQVLASRGAVATRPASSDRATAPRPAAPAKASPSAHLQHTSHRLMAEHERQHRLRQLAISDVQIGAAHAASLHSKQSRPAPGERNRQVLQLERARRPTPNHRAHARHSVHPISQRSHQRNVRISCTSGLVTGALGRSIAVSTQRTSCSCLRGDAGSLAEPRCCSDPLLNKKPHPELGRGSGGESARFSALRSSRALFRWNPSLSCLPGTRSRRHSPDASALGQRSGSSGRCRLRNRRLRLDPCVGEG